MRALSLPCEQPIKTSNQFQSRVNATIEVEVEEDEEAFANSAILDAKYCTVEQKPKNLMLFVVFLAFCDNLVLWCFKIAFWD